MAVRADDDPAAALLPLPQNKLGGIRSGAVSARHGARVDLQERNVGDQGVHRLYHVFPIFVGALIKEADILGMLGDQIKVTDDVNLPSLGQGGKGLVVGFGVFHAVAAKVGIDHALNGGGVAVKAHVFSVDLQIVNRADDIIVGSKIKLGIEIQLDAAENIELSPILFLHGAHVGDITLHLVLVNTVLGSVKHGRVSRKAHRIKAARHGMQDHLLHAVLAVAPGAVSMQIL